ncbi:MAG: glycosyltransferase, partial [Acidimicrobiia bacterium]|nr:glycosyltransferase [Acidimicrobiia bacterium]
STTMPTYVDILQDRYGATNVYLGPHGVFDELPFTSAAPVDSRRRIITFGKFGTYKRIEGLIAAYRQLLARGYDDVELVIAGSDSPNSAGYLDGVRSSVSDLPAVSFTGYVAEEDVPALFESASVVAFPYTSTTGSSGPLHQAGTFGRAAVVPELGDFLDLVGEEGFTGVPFDPSDDESLADALAAVLDSDELRDRLGRTNHAAATGLPLADIVEWHVRHIDELIAA